MNEDRNSILGSNKDSHSIIGKTFDQIMEENKRHAPFMGKTIFNVKRLKAVRTFNKIDIFNNHLKSEDREKLIKGFLIDTLSKELYDVANIEKN